MLQGGRDELEYRDEDGVADEGGILPLRTALGALDGDAPRGERDLRYRGELGVALNALGLPLARTPRVVDRP